MAFVNQLMLWGMLAVAVPIAVHLIQRRKARRIPFPAIEFILRSRKAVAKRFRLKQILLLALRCLLVAAIAGAAARPLFAGRDAAVGPSGGPAAVAIAVDTSLSMRARVGGKSAFEAARDAAAALVNGLGPDVEAVVVPFADDAKVLPAVPTADKTVLSQAVSDLKPGYGRTNVARALDAASAAIASSQKPRKLVYVFTDAAAPGWSEVMPRDPALEVGYRVVDVTGTATPNTALIALEVREEGSEAVARAEVQSFSDEPLTGVSVEMLENDRPSGRNFVDLAPGATASTVFTIPSPSAGLNVATARVQSDALEEDDTRFAVFRGRGRVRTLLVDGDPQIALREAETFYLERALAPTRTSTSSVQPIVMDAEGLARANLADYDVVVLANVGELPGPTVAALERWVSNGGGLLFTAGDRVEAARANASFRDLLPMRLRGVRAAVSAHSEGGATEARHLTLGPVPASHPVSDALDTGAEDVLGATRFEKTQLLEAGASGAGTVLKFSDGSPALVERAHGRGRVALLASSIDREWSNLPISTLYVPLTRRLVRFLAGELSDDQVAAVIVGNPVQVEVGEHARVRIDGPEGFAAEVLPAVEGVVEVTPTLPGVYRLSKEDGTPDERLALKGFAANVDTAEGELRKVTAAELARIFDGVDFATSGGLEGGEEAPSSATPDQPLWGLLLGLGLIAVVLESTISQL